MDRPARLIVRAVLALAAFAGAAGAWAVVVKVGVYDNPPKVVLDTQGRPSGIFVDVLASLAREEGLELQYVQGSFQQGLERLHSGDIDLMVDVARTEDREARFDFNRVPVLQSWNEIYARPRSGIRNIFDLNGKRVAVLHGSVQETFLQEEAQAFGIRAEVLRYPTYEAAFEAVRGGRADAVAANPFYGVRHLDGLAETAIVFGATALHYAAAPGRNAALLQAIDQHLAKLKANPESVYAIAFERLVAAQKVERVPPWVVPAAGTAAAFLALALAWALTSRRTAARLRVAEQRQRDLAEVNRRVFDHSLDVICVLGGDLRIRRISPSVARFGWTPDELVGRSVLDGIPAERREPARQVLQGVMEGHPVLSRSILTLRSDGTASPSTFSAVWVPRVQEMYCVVHDESERMALLAEVEQRNRELAAANEDLKVLGFSLSHDLRSPLAAVRGFVGAALESQDLEARQGRLLQRAAAAAARMDGMVGDLAELLKIAGAPVQPEPCDLGALAADIAQSLRERGGDATRFDIQEGMVVAADPRLLRIMLENLLGNAWKFSSRVAAPRVEVGCDARREPPAFFVRDNGAGFDMAYASRLFQPFSRLHGRDEFPGSGMGLTIVERVVAKHGGRVWAESAPDAGATFFFTLDDTAAPGAQRRG